MIPARPEYLRISVTGRCNLRCIYCRPRGGGSAGGELSPDELRLLVECAAAEGVRKVRLTGGEPLMRPDLADLVRAVSGVGGIEETTMTTNGVELAERAGELRRAGLERVNVSLDSLRPERFRQLSGVDALERVLAGLDAAVGVFGEVKTNTVLLSGRNDDEVADIVRMAGERGLRARFIEYYPALRAPALEGVPAREVRRRLERAFGPLVPLQGDALSVARPYRVPAVAAEIGIIASAADPPCERCAKLRVSAAGKLLPCLFAAHGVDLGPLLRSGDRAGLRRAIRTVFAGKKRRGRAERAVASASELGG